MNLTILLSYFYLKVLFIFSIDIKFDNTESTKTKSSIIVMGLKKRSPITFSDV